VAGPWEKYGSGGSGSVYGLPRTPAPQTPAQTQSDQLGVVRTQQQIASQPLQNESTQTSIEQNRSSMQNQRFNQNQGLRQEFNNLPEVKNYGVAATSLNTALKAPDSPQGDLAIIYALRQGGRPRLRRP
jgi:hypothetical protein